EGVLGELNAAQRKALERIMEGSRRLTRMVRNVLDYAQLASGRLALVPETVDLTELVRTSLEAERVQWMKKGLHLDSSLPETAVPAWGDPARIEQVLGEILDNAIKFTPDGGKIRVTLSSEGDQATVEIQDSGAGIPSEALPHLFEPFYQFDLTSTRRFGGMGLGLAIVRHLIEGMGGCLSIQSSLGRGTTVRFTLRKVPGIIS
ncbi:MAG: sensor histidine kinase, partial [Bacteroidota bacterium]